MRFTAFIFPLLALGAAGYFGYHLQTGDHGLKARADLERRKRCSRASSRVCKR